MQGNATEAEVGEHGSGRLGDEPELKPRVFGHSAAGEYGGFLLHGDSVVSRAPPHRGL